MNAVTMFAISGAIGIAIGYIIGWIWEARQYRRRVSGRFTYPAFREYRR